MSTFWSRMKQLFADNPAPRYGEEARGRDAGTLEGDDLSPAELAGLGALVELLAARLGPERAVALAEQSIQAAERDMGAAAAFASGTNTNADFALSVYLDWDGQEETEWQINRVLETLELADRWRWEPDVTGRSMTATFKALEDWLAERGYHVWHVKTDGDDALLFPVARENMAAAEQLAGQFGMRLFTLAESKPYYGELTTR